MATNILVTGANGQLGSELKVLSEKFHQFDFIFTDIEELDLNDAQKLDVFFEQNKPDYIINCAAYTAVDRAEQEPDLAMKLNFNIVNNLIQVADQFKAKLVHISTDYVFDGTAHVPYSEDDYTNPNSIYGETKRAAELLLSESEIDYIIIRTSWLYSSFGNNFVKTMLRLASERDSLNVIYDQIGTPTYARDLADAILQIIEKDEQSDVNLLGNQIFHYSNEGVASWYDFATAIFKIKGMDISINPIETIEYPTPAARPAYSVFSKKKIKNTFALQIPHWQKSLEKCLEFI